MKRLAVIAIALSSCAAPPRLATEAAGVSRTQELVSVGAIIRIDAPLQDVLVAIEFRSSEGNVIARTEDTLAACEATCIWGGTFRGEQFGPEWGSIATVRVAARGGEPLRLPAPRAIAATRAPDGSVTGTAPDPGSVHVIAVRSGSVLGGVQISIDEDRSFRIPPELLPRTQGEELRAAWYPSLGPQGD
jgi:hypothetical protein